MNIRIANYESLAYKFLKKAEKADQQNLFKLSSKYFSIVQKIYRLANSDLTEKINQNKNVIREYNREALESFIDSGPNKDEIHALFQSLEFPYQFNFGDTSQQHNKDKIMEIINLALKINKRGVNSDIALALAECRDILSDDLNDRSGTLQGFDNPYRWDVYDKPNRYEKEVDFLISFLESRNEKYGFVNDRRMDFRTPALLIDLKFNLFREKELPPLVHNRREFLDLMYSEGEHFSYGSEHFHSTLNFNYFFGKNSIQFAKKCQSENFGNPIVDIPHDVDNTLSLKNLDNHPGLGQFIVDNYFKVNIRQEMENWIKFHHRFGDAGDIKALVDQLMDPKNDAIGVNVYGTIRKKRDFLRDAYTKIRSNIALIAENWKREVRVNENEYKLIQDISNYSLEKISKILEEDIIANDIGYENINNFPLFKAMLKYQKDDISRFLKIQELYDNKQEESEWYADLCKLKVENDSYIARILPKKDLRFPFVGAITGCCQKLYGHGDDAFRNTFEPDSGILIVTDKKDNIVSQSYIWTHGGFSVTLDSIESKYKNNLNKEDFRDIYEKACKDILAKYFDLVLCGNNNTWAPITDNDRIIPLDIFENNDPNTYTYDTQNGRSILYHNQQAIEEHPYRFTYITIYEKLDNNLNQPLTQIEINAIAYNQNIVYKYQRSIVNKYTDEIDDVLNKDNLIKFYNDMSATNINLDDDFITLCRMIDGAHYDFDANHTESTFQICLNKWLRDGGLIYLHTQDEQIIRDLHKINYWINDEGYAPTKLFNTQKIFCLPPDEIDPITDVAGFISSSDDSDRKSIFNMLSNNVTFSNLITKILKLNHPDDLINKSNKSWKHLQFPFLTQLTEKYIDNNAFSMEDFNTFRKIGVLEEFSDQALDNIINKGILNFYFQTDEENNKIVPTENELSRIHSIMLSFKVTPEKNKNILKQFADNFMNNVSSYFDIEQYSTTAWRINQVIQEITSQNLTDININDYNIQKIFSICHPYYPIPNEINTIYASASYILYKPELFKFAPVLNLIMDEDGYMSTTLFKSPEIKRVNIIIPESKTLTQQIIDNLHPFSEKTYFNIEDLITFFNNEINPDTIQSSINFFKRHTGNNYTIEQLKEYVYEHFMNVFSGLFNQFNEIKTIVRNKINHEVDEHLKWEELNNQRINQIQNQQATQPQNTTQEPEEQKEITAHRKTSRYTIKQK